MRGHTPVPRLRPLLNVARLRAFAARLKAARLLWPAAASRRVQHIGPVARVLRRAQVVLHRHTLSRHALTQVLVSLARSDPPRLAPSGSPVAARMPLVQRLVERRTLRVLERAVPMPMHGMPQAARPATAPPVMRLASPSRGERPLVFPRVTMTLVRPQAPQGARFEAAPAGEPMSAAARRPTTGPSGRTAQSPTGEPIVLPPLELSRVTDHVLRQLDQRVLSWRERTGQL